MSACLFTYLPVYVRSLWLLVFVRDEDSHLRCLQVMPFAAPGLTGLQSAALWHCV